MNVRRAGQASPAARVFVLLLALPAPGGAADLLLTGGVGYTVDAARSWAEAIGVRDGRIGYVGSTAGALRWAAPGALEIPLHGRFVLPAFHDAHVHPIAGGIELAQCWLFGLDGAAEVLERVAECAARDHSPWLLGTGWELPVFEGANPSREALDSVVRDRPALLHAADGHSAWVNSRALELAGLDAATPDPPGGRIERHPVSGAPSGTLRETAIALVADLAPAPTLDEGLAGLERVQRMLHGFGVTAVQEAAAGGFELDVYRRAEGDGRLALRVTAALETDAGLGPEQVAGLVRRRAEGRGRLVRATAAKLFLDGVIEARTAAMLEPYLDRPGQRGEPLWEESRLRPLVAALVAEGFDVHVHAIGDRAVRLALDALEGAAEAPGSGRRPRHQIAHLEVVHPSDVPRFARLGVIANAQALWAWADSYITDLTWPALGPERSRWIYPWGSLHRAGAALALGSDWSVSSANPLLAIEVALTRRDPDGSPGEPMQPGERLDLPTALAAATMGGAWALGVEEESGSIEVGKWADLVVLERNPFELPPEAIGEVEVAATFFEGRAVYERPGWELPGSAQSPAAREAGARRRAIGPGARPGEAPQRSVRGPRAQTR